MAEKNITQLLEEATSQICDEYCRWPWECETDEELIEGHCETCPLVQFLS